MQNIPLEKAIFFGPIHSRRLGRSLGINLLPTAVKCCSFDCVYCFFGSTPTMNGEAVSPYLPTFEEVTSAIDKALADIGAGTLAIDFITFAGNGEPTLHPAYPAVVDYLLEALKGVPGKIGTAVFTNGSRLKVPEVFKATARLDQAIVKLDIVDKEGFQRINRPKCDVELEEIAINASKLPRLMVQTAVMKIGGKIYDESSLNYYCHLLKLASPQEVQLYNIIYPPAEIGVETVTMQELTQLADKIRTLTRFKVRTYDEVEMTDDVA